MAVNGFDDGKNKVSVYTTVEVDTNKQDKHITRTAFLPSTGWIYNSSLSRYEQIRTVTGVTEDNTVIVAPDPSNYVRYIDSMVVCAGQGISGGGTTSDTLVFVCHPEKVPTTDLTVNILILGV